MRKDVEYSFRRESTVWAVIRWQKTTGGSYRGDIIETYDLKENARRRVYELNGWK